MANAWIQDGSVQTWDIVDVPVHTQLLSGNACLLYALTHLILHSTGVSPFLWPVDDWVSKKVRGYSLRLSTTHLACNTGQHAPGPSASHLVLCYRVGLMTDFRSFLCIGVNTYDLYPCEHAREVEQLRTLSSSAALDRLLLERHQTVSSQKNKRTWELVMDDYDVHTS